MQIMMSNLHHHCFLAKTPSSEESPGEEVKGFWSTVEETHEIDLDITKFVQLLKQ